MKQSAGHLKTQNNPQSGAQETEKHGLCDEKENDGVSGQAKGAKEADLGSAANHVGGDGIGDEKHADDEGDEGEGCEVELKGAEHFFDLLASALGGAGPGVGGQVS